MKVNTNYYVIELQPHWSRLHSLFIPNKITQTEPPTINVFCIFASFYMNNTYCAPRPPPPFLLGGWTSYQIFKKGGLAGPKF